MHVWLAYRDDDGRGFLIDPTAGTWPERARASGLRWTSPEPPAFLWHSRDEFDALERDSFPLGITYQADLLACRLAYEAAQDGSPSIYDRSAEALGLKKRVICEGRS